MKDTEVIIIGAGMGGLAAGGLLASKGIKVIVVEKESHVGGYVWGFRREGFYFDATGAFLSACRPGGEFFSILQDMGIADTIIFEPITDVWNIYPGFDLRMNYRSPSAYLDAVKSRFPRQAETLESYGRLSTRLGEEFMAFERAPWWKKVMLPVFFPNLLRYARKSHAQIFNRFFGNDQRISLALSSLPTTLPPSALSYPFVAVLWAKVLNQGVFYPKGGMKGISEAMARAILDNGGEILLNSEATKILVRDGKASGVALQGGEEIRAEWVIGGVNPFKGQDMLPGGRRLYGRMHALHKFKPSLSAVLFYLGLPAAVLPGDWPYFISICTTLDQEGMHNSLEKGFMENGLHMVITTPTVIDPTLGPEGHHSLKVLVHCPGSGPFEKRYGTEAAFESLRRDVFSLIHSHTGVDMGTHALLVEKATPLTLLRLTGNEGGAMYGFDAALNQVGPMRPPNRTALDNLLWVGHYTHPAHGIVGSSMSGRFVSEIILESQRN